MKFNKGKIVMLVKEFVEEKYEDFNYSNYF